MDPRRNPYAPGAGTPPPELAGRDRLIEDASIALDRIRNGLAAKSLLMVGLRGVGKTVLLNRVCRDAEGRGFVTVLLEAPEDRSLPGLLCAPLHAALLKMSRFAATGDAAKRALRALGGFVGAMKLGFGDVTFNVDLEVDAGVADSGDLDSDLSALVQAAGEAARAQRTALVLFIDELQYVEERELGALIAALHRAAQLQLPVTLVGAGLPQLVARAGAAKSYAERLFTFPEIGPLDTEAAMLAIEAPARAPGRLLRARCARPDHTPHPVLPIFPSGVGQALLGLRRSVTDRCRRSGSRHTRGRRRARCKLLPGPVRPSGPVGEAVPASNGRARGWLPSIR